VFKVPHVTYTGPFYERRRRDSNASWIRGKKGQVTQEWLNEWRHTLPETHFLIEGDEEVTVDGGNDGLPDNGWSRKDILEWLDEQNVDLPNGYITKTKALTLVDEHLNPTENGDE
jgi:hypothetical protein